MQHAGMSKETISASSNARRPSSTRKLTVRYQACCHTVKILTISLGTATQSVRQLSLACACSTGSQSALVLRTKPLPSLPVATCQIRQSPIRRSLIDCTEKPLKQTFYDSSSMTVTSEEEDWPTIEPTKVRCKNLPRGPPQQITESNQAWARAYTKVCAG